VVLSAIMLYGLYDRGAFGPQMLPYFSLSH